MLPVPTELKHLTAIASRAQELENVEPAVSYWARYWIVQDSVASQQVGRASRVEEYLMDVLSQLEAMKTKYAGMAEIEKMDIGHAKVKTFALQIFDNADREEQAKRATKATASKFLAAAAFLEVCQVFGVPEKDLVDKRKYAKVQAMRIQTAFAAGRDPNSKSKTKDNLDLAVTAAETAELDALLTATSVSSKPDADQMAAVANVAENSEIGHVQSRPSTPLENVPDLSGSNELADFSMSSQISTLTDKTLPSVDAALTDEATTTSVSLENHLPENVSRTDEPVSQPAVIHADSDAMISAQKHAKWAISALNYDDVGTAILELRRALSALEGSQ